MKTPTHCSKPMRRSETKKGNPWWCSQCGEYIERDAVNNQTVSFTGAVKPEPGSIPDCPDWISAKPHVSIPLTIPKLPQFDIKLPDITDSCITADKLAPIYVRNDESDEALRKRILERLNARTTPRASVIRSAVTSALRNEFGYAPDVEVAITGSIAHITVSGIDWARVSKEDFEEL